MCESYLINCQCGAKKAEIFFGKMLLGENSVKQLFCPACSKGHEDSQPQRVWDNGWVLELNMDIIISHSSTFGMVANTITAEWIFDNGYVTWVGITPDDTERRNKEREKIQQLAKIDVLAYIKAMKEWGLEREKRFCKEGWRKMKV
ncbi:MAG: hypothetical protein GY799_03175 [Desulfobulbaceae bacterium]|nr:hypothetical protein [Desulfobulbaceae bacterium]